MKRVNTAVARTLHGKAKLAKFCCEAHKDKTKGHMARRPYGQRESLTQPQVAHVFRIMFHKIGCAWSAGNATTVCVHGEAGRPTITWPRVNLKTAARESILDSGVAKLIWRWISTQPLHTSKGSSWPWPDQSAQEHLAQGTRCLLVPGRVLGGRDKRSEQAVTARAYNQVWKRCQEILRSEISQARQRGEVCFKMWIYAVSLHTVRKSHA